MDAVFFMNSAYQEAIKAFDEGDVPVGAVIEKDGRIIGKGHNSMEKLSDATAHAEVIAISAASSSVENWRLAGCTLYVTLEPCIMCLGAILQARIDSVVYGAKDPRMGAVDSFFHRQELERSYRFFPTISSGLMADECGRLMTSFFQKIRKKN
jgi:tRNA(adenine34) deaminase